MDHENKLPANVGDIALEKNKKQLVVLYYIYIGVLVKNAVVIA